MQLKLVPIQSHWDLKFAKALLKKILQNYFDSLIYIAKRFKYLGVYFRPVITPSAVSHNIAPDMSFILRERMLKELLQNVSITDGLLQD